jgi:hypothetical protein
MNKIKKDLLSHRDLNFLIKNQNPIPEKDSPASSSENQQLEYLLGMEYAEESLEEMKDSGELILADYPADDEELS